MRDRANFFGKTGEVYEHLTIFELNPNALRMTSSVWKNVASFESEETPILDLEQNAHLTARI